MGWIQAEIPELLLKMFSIAIFVSLKAFLSGRKLSWHHELYGLQYVT